MMRNVLFICFFLASFSLHAADIAIKIDKILVSATKPGFLAGLRNCNAGFNLAVDAEQNDIVRIAIEKALETIAPKTISYKVVKLRLTRKESTDTFELYQGMKDAQITFKDLNLDNDVIKVVLSVSCVRWECFDKEDEQD